MPLWCLMGMTVWNVSCSYFMLPPEVFRWTACPMRHTGVNQRDSITIAAVCRSHHEQWCLAGVLGSLGKWDSLLLPHKKESKWERQVQRYIDSNRRVKILPFKIFRAGGLHNVCSTEEWVCSQILTPLNWNHQQVYENSTVLTKSLNNSLWLRSLKIN